MEEVQSFRLGTLHEVDKVKLMFPMETTDNVAHAV